MAQLIKVCSLYFICALFAPSLFAEVEAKNYGVLPYETRSYFCELHTELVYILASNKGNMTEKEMTKQITKFAKVKRLSPADIEYLKFLVSFIFYHKGTSIQVSEMYSRECYSTENSKMTHKDNNNSFD